MTSPMISVVMPVYNAEKYVVEAIESILNQTYSDFEFIIIDDCSTDNTFKVLQSYILKDNRIRLFRNVMNRKQAYTKNRAIELAQGKYIAFMDADDISLPVRFEKQIEFMESHPEVGVCGTWIEVFSEESSQTTCIKYPVEHKLISVKLLFDENCIAHPSTFLRRDIFFDLQIYYNLSLQGYAEDYELWVRLLEQGVLFYNLPEILLMYRKSDVQTMVVFKQQIDFSAQSIIKNSFERYFIQYIELSVINAYLKLRFTPKKKLSFFQHLYYQYLILKIKRVNLKFNLFDKKVFDDILDKESIIRLFCRYLENQYAAKFKKH